MRGKGGSVTDLHTVCGVSPVTQPEMLSRSLTQLSTPGVLSSLNYGDLFV